MTTILSTCPPDFLEFALKQLRPMRPQEAGQRAPIPVHLDVTFDRRLR